MVFFLSYSGVNDIKKHRWFNNFSWDDLMKKKIKPSYVPVVKSLGDVSNFDEYPDSGSHAQDIKPSLDPFLNWWYFTSLIFKLDKLFLKNTIVLSQKYNRRIFLNITKKGKKHKCKSDYYSRDAVFNFLHDHKPLRVLILDILFKRGILKWSSREIYLLDQFIEVSYLYIIEGVFGVRLKEFYIFHFLQLLSLYR